MFLDAFPCDRTASVIKLNANIRYFSIYRFEVITMLTKTVSVRMFGNFTIESDGRSIDDSSNRSRKVWLLLAYLVYNRDRAVPQEELIDLLWGENDRDSDPRGALKAIFYRVRTSLDLLGNSAGHELIINKAGAYAWNSNYTVVCDTDEFERLIEEASAAENKDRALELYQQALDLYQGSFLSRMSIESWVIPLEVYFSKLYSDAVMTTLELLRERNLTESVYRTAKNALQYDPYNEDIYLYYMNAMLSLDDRKGVVDAYESLKEQLYAMFSIQPSEKIREIYREACKTINTVSVSADDIREQLREQDASKGALICEFDFFKVLYHSAARTVIRNGDTIHIAMFSVSGSDGEELAKRSLDRAMENLQEQIRINLRSGDSAARCSSSQFVVMLQQSNYENSCMVCDRIVRAYHRQYPHSPAEIRYTVQPLEPML